jgi:transposase
LADKDRQLAQSERLHTGKNTKLQALIYELAYYKRLRFGRETGILAGLQRDLFREDVESDLSAIEAELEAFQALPL